MCSNFLQNERQPAIGVLGSLGCTYRVRLLSSKAWNTNGSLISFDLNINTHLLLSKMSLLSPDGADSEELPGEGVLLVLDHVTTDLHRQPRPVGHLDVPGDGERPEALQMSEMSTLESWTLSFSTFFSYLMVFSALSSVMQYTLIVFIQARGKFSR